LPHLPCMHFINDDTMKEEKILQVVNLSPDPAILVKLVEMHPMKQVFYASIVQVGVLVFLLVSISIIDVFT